MSLGERLKEVRERKSCMLRHHECKIIAYKFVE